MNHFTLLCAGFTKKNSRTHSDGLEFLVLTALMVVPPRSSTLGQHVERHLDESSHLCWTFRSLVRIQDGGR